MSGYGRMLEEVRAQEQARLAALEEQRAAFAADAGLPAPTPRQVITRDSNRRGL